MKHITRALTVVIALSWVTHVHDGPRLRAQTTSLPVGNWPVAYDFDGDFRADGISLRSNGFDKTIQIRFGNSRNAELAFSANIQDYGTVVADDIDHDGDLDLIWFGNSDEKTAVIWINNGKGDFAEAKDNAPYSSELNRLVSGSDSSSHSFQAGRQTWTFTQSSPDTGLTVTSRLACASTRPVSLSAFDGFAKQSIFLSYLSKRGPPLMLL